MNALKKSLVCPVCKESKTSFLKQHQDYSIFTCKNCGLFFSNPMKEPPASFYENSYIYKYRSKENNLVEDSLKSGMSKDWRFNTALDKVSTLENKTQNNKVLDIGCGEGGFLYLMKQRDFNVFGIDVDSRAVKIAQTSFGLGNVAQKNWKELIKNGNLKNFTLITIFDTLEHVSDPSALAIISYKLLQNKGTLFITVPSYERNPRIFDSQADNPPHHLTLWTKKALEILLKNSGFKKIQIIEKPLQGQDLQLHLIWFIKRLLSQRENQKKPSNKKEEIGWSRGFVVRQGRSILLMLLNIFALMIRFARLSRGQTYFVIAQKS